MNWAPAATFFRKPRNPDLEWIGKRILGRADEHVRALLEFEAAEEAAVVAHHLHGLQELSGIQVEYVGGVGMVPETLMVAGEAEDVVDSEGRCTQDIALDGDAIPVAGNHLENGFQPHLLDADAGSQAAHSHHSGLVVGHVDGVDIISDGFCLRIHHRAFRTPGWTAFRCDGEMTCTQNLFQPAWRYGTHVRETSLTTLRGPPSRLFDQSFGSVGCSNRSSWPSSLSRS